MFLFVLKGLFPHFIQKESSKSDSEEFILFASATLVTSKVQLYIYEMQQLQQVSRKCTYTLECKIYYTVTHTYTGCGVQRTSCLTQLINELD